MSAARSRQARTTASADCVTCGEQGPVSTYDLAAARRWASSHAERNPGHSAHLMQERTRVYEATR